MSTLSDVLQAFTRTAENCGAAIALTSSSYDHVKKAAGIKAKLTRTDTQWPELNWVSSASNISHRDDSRPFWTCMQTRGPEGIAECHCSSHNDLKGSVCRHHIEACIQVCVP